MTVDDLVKAMDFQVNVVLEVLRCEIDDCNDPAYCEVYNDRLDNGTFLCIRHRNEFELAMKTTKAVQAVSLVEPWEYPE